MAVYLRSEYRAAGSNLISDHADATAPPTGPASPSSPDLAPRLSPARGGRNTLPPEPPSLPLPGNKPSLVRRHHCPVGAGAAAAARGDAQRRGARAEGRGGGCRRECGCVFGFGARSRWMQDGEGKRSCLVWSLAGAGQGAVRWGGEGRRWKTREMRAWFENFRIKNSWGLELRRDRRLKMALRRWAVGGGGSCLQLVSPPVLL
jgi:hypothetical protein